jgi:hypothetical protein
MACLLHGIVLFVGQWITFPLSIIPSGLRCSPSLTHALLGQSSAVLLYGLLYRFEVCVSRPHFIENFRGQRYENRTLKLILDKRDHEV